MKQSDRKAHNDIILCVVHRGDVMKQYFLTCEECLSNDFTLSNGGRHLHLRSRDIEDWRITFVDTGINANIGQRLKAVEPYLEGEEMFMANYSDGLSDLPLPEYLTYFREQQRV